MGSGRELRIGRGSALVGEAEEGWKRGRRGKVNGRLAEKSWWYSGEERLVRVRLEPAWAVTCA